MDKNVLPDDPFSNCEVPASVMGRMQMLSPPPTEGIKSDYQCETEKCVGGVVLCVTVNIGLGISPNDFLLKFTLHDALRFGN